MNLLSDILALITTITAFLFVIGLVRPGFVVFWSPDKSRSKVVTVWGVLVVVSALAFFVVKSQHDDPRKDGTDVRKSQ